VHVRDVFESEIGAGGTVTGVGRISGVEPTEINILPWRKAQNHEPKHSSSY